MNNLKLYKLEEGDIFTTLKEISSLDSFQLSLQKTFYIHIRKWYNPISWFKRYRCYRYKVEKIINKS